MAKDDYEIVQENVPFEIDIEEGQKLWLACCFCSLVHTIEFTVLDNRKLQIVMCRNERETKKRRKNL
jgi:uncharacterized Zn finger protein